jgi:hypothetical protein
VGVIVAVTSLPSFFAAGLVWAPLLLIGAGLYLGFMRKERCSAARLLRRGGALFCRTAASARRSAVLPHGCFGAAERCSAALCHSLSRPSGRGV